jgi:hypothetical protein
MLFTAFASFGFAPSALVDFFATPALALFVDFADFVECVAWADFDECVE